MTTSKRTVLITGCSDGGLGAALAHAFHRTQQWRVIASARNQTKLTGIRAAGIETITLDVLQQTSIADAVAEVTKLTGGTLDMLLNNAGAGYQMPLLDVDLDEARRLYDLNVFSLISMLKAFFPLLRATQGSKLVNNTSCVSVGGLPLDYAYNSSKAAAAAITEGLRIELSAFDIQVIDLKTGIVRSKFMDNLSSDLSKDIPEGSPYRVPGLHKHVGLEISKDRIQKDGMDSKVWAESVVHEISKSKPSGQVWRGAKANLVRLSAHLPLGMFDGMAKQMSGLEGIEAEIRAEKHKKTA